MGPGVSRYNQNMKNMKKSAKKNGKTAWLAMCVDIGDSSDFRPVVLKAFATKKGADDFVKKDMDRYMEDSKGAGLDADYAERRAFTDEGYGCQWSVQEVALP